MLSVLFWDIGFMMFVLLCCRRGGGWMRAVLLCSALGNVGGSWLAGLGDMACFPGPQKKVRQC